MVIVLVLVKKQAIWKIRGLSASSFSDPRNCLLWVNTPCIIKFAKKVISGISLDPRLKSEISSRSCLWVKSGTKTMDSVLLGSFVVKIFAGQPVCAWFRARKKCVVELAQNNLRKTNTRSWTFFGFARAERSAQVNLWYEETTAQVERCVKHYKRTQNLTKKESLFRRVCLHELVECCIVFLYVLCRCRTFHIFWIFSLQCAIVWSWTEYTTKQNF
jgi:hypothetical protein